MPRPIKSKRKSLRKAVAAGKAVKNPKLPPGWVEVRVYMLTPEKNWLKKAADSREMSLSEYCRTRILSAGEIVVTGDIIPG